MIKMINGSSSFFLLRFALLLALSQVTIISAFAQYLYLPVDHPQQLSNTNFLHIDCPQSRGEPSETSFFLSEIFTSDGKIKPQRCEVSSPLFSSSFYFVESSQLTNPFEEYKCENKNNVLICGNKTRSAYGILYCETLGNLSEPILFLHSKQNEDIIVSCIQKNEFQLPLNVPESLFAYYSSKFPIVKEYIIPQGQFMKIKMSSNEINLRCFSVNHHQSIRFDTNTKGECIGKTIQEITFRNPSERIEVRLLLTDQTNKYGMKISFHVKPIILDKEISAFYSNQDENMIFLIGKEFPQNFTYEIVNQEENIRLICERLNLENSTKRNVLPEILQCKELIKPSFNCPTDASRVWKLNIKDKESLVQTEIYLNVNSFSGFQEQINIPILNQELEPKKHLILSLDSEKLGTWIINHKGPRIIDCEFFMDQSTMGVILDSQRVLCPMPNKYYERYENIFNQYQVHVTTGDYLYIYFTRSALKNQTTSLSKQSRSLQTLIFAFSPLKPDIIIEPEEEDTDDETINDADLLDAIFNLDSYSVALITLDLRFLSLYKTEFNYGTDWEISITVGSDLGLDDLTSAVLPESFFVNNYQKNQVQELILTARVDVEFKVDIIIHDENFLDVKYAFVNSTSVEIVQPYRARYPEHVSFYAMINADDEVGLPVNIPELNAEGNLPDFWLNLGSTRGDDEVLAKHTLINGVNYFNPKELYWGDESYVSMPYLPFFSNCKGYDKHIPIFTLFEQNPSCNLVPPESTVFIRPFGFGSQPVSDNCTDIQLQCIYDEDLDENTDVPRWFEQGPDVLFYLTKDPHAASDMDRESVNLKTSNFIPVKVSGDYEVDKLPTLVTFHLNYYQVSKTDKRLVTAKVRLENFITPTEAQKNGTATFPYTLQISLTPLGHTDLIVAFEFESYVYLMLYVIIGLVMAGYISIFFLFHYLTSRRRKKISPKLWAYFKLNLPPALKGVLLAIIPQVPLIIIIAAILLGQIWNTPLHGCSNRDSACYRSPFDAFTMKGEGITERNSNEFENLRNGRAGFAFNVIGFILMWIGSRKLVKCSDDKKMQEAFDGNVWQSNFWNQMGLIFYGTLQVLWITAIIQFSFTTTYGDNVFIFIALMKGIGMTIQFSFDRVFHNRLLVTPLMTAHTLTESVITFGAKDFLDFLVGGFIDLSIQMVERGYVSPVFEAGLEYAEEQYPQIAKFIKKLLLAQEDDDDTDEEDGKENSSPKKDKEKNKASPDKDKEKDKDGEEDQVKDKNQSVTDESLDSNILLTDMEESGNSSVSISLLADIGIDSDFNDSDDDFEIRFKERLRKKEKEKKVEVRDGHNKEDEDRDEAIDTIFGFAVDLLVLIYQPFYIVLMWIFYDQNKFGVGYDIAEEDFIFYLLFQIVIIPFQVIIDILHYNIAEYYHHADLYNYVIDCKERFNNRSILWKADEDDVNEDLEDRFQRIDMFCFSSQFYFIVTVFLSGMAFLILGTQTIIVADYIIYKDVAAIYITMTVSLICLGIYLITIYIGKRLKIWEVKKDDETETASNEEKEDELFSFDEKRLDLVTRKLPEWEKVAKVKSVIVKLEEVIQEVQTTKFKDPELKSKLILDNQYWFTSSMREVFTPTTLKNKRGTIINSFKTIFGELSPSGTREAEAKEEVVVKKMDFREKKTIKKSLSFAFITILKQWKMRGTLIRKIRSQVAGLMESTTAKACEFCASNQNLRAELVSNIESLFMNFLRDNPLQSSLVWDIDDWQESFKKNALIRTLCFACYTQILDHHIKTSIEETRQKRYNERRKTDPKPGIEYIGSGGERIEYIGSGGENRNSRTYSTSQYEGKEDRKSEMNIMALTSQDFKTDPNESNLLEDNQGNERIALKPMDTFGVPN